MGVYLRAKCQDSSRILQKGEGRGEVEKFVLLAKTMIKR